MLNVSHCDQGKHAGYAHLVVVAGTSGSGKSTFVDQLLARDLPDDINARLPAGIHGWPVVGASMKPILPDNTDGFIFQYDMNGRGIAGGRDFDDDPALSCLSLTQIVTVINLRPSTGLMIDQLVAREGGGRTREQLLRERFWSPRQPLIRKILNKWQPWIDCKRRHSCRRKINLYNQAGWLDGLYERWQIYLHSLGTKGTTIEQIFLEPDMSTQVGNAYSWRIVSGLGKGDAEPSKERRRPPHVKAKVERAS